MLYDMKNCVISSVFCDNYVKVLKSKRLCGINKCQVVAITASMFRHTGEDWPLVFAVKSGFVVPQLLSPQQTKKIMQGVVVLPCGVFICLYCQY